MDGHTVRYADVAGHLSWDAPTGEVPPDTESIWWRFTPLGMPACTSVWVREEEVQREQAYDGRGDSTVHGVLSVG